MTPDEIDKAVDILREVCDPRGHDLLEVIRTAWKHDAQAADLLEGLADALKPENQSHSRNAEARADVIWLRDA